MMVIISNEAVEVNSSCELEDIRNKLATAGEHEASSGRGLAARIRHHPGLEWKALNVREFKRR